MAFATVFSATPRKETRPDPVRRCGESLGWRGTGRAWPGTAAERSALSSNRMADVVPEEVAGMRQVGVEEGGSRRGTVVGCFAPRKTI